MYNNDELPVHQRHRCRWPQDSWTLRRRCRPESRMGTPGSGSLGALGWRIAIAENRDNTKDYLFIANFWLRVRPPLP